MQKIYFPGLNGLRFIGAFIVIIGHLEFIKSLYSLPNLMHLSFYSNTSGHMGVLLFFVLSGFLITYLLLQEQESTSSINVFNFYLRRVFRIWPLYYLMVLISIFVLPEFLQLINVPSQHFSFEETKYYFFFLPNVAKALQHFVPGAVHLWSIGVEEQFYLLWPLLIICFRKNIILLLALVFIGVSILPHFLDFVNNNYFNFHERTGVNYKQLTSFVDSFKINSMAIGGFFAFIVKRKIKWFDFLKNDIIEPLIFLLTFYLWFSGQIIINGYNDETYSVLFALIIFNISTKANPVFTLEQNIFKFLGKISYGLYVYHWLVIVVIIEIITNYFPALSFDLLITNSILYISSVFITILLSYLSFEYFETPFLKIKERFN